MNLKKVGPARPVNEPLIAGKPIRPEDLRLPQVILDTDYNPPFQQNPPFDPSDPGWASDVAGGKEWLSGLTPAWEWTPILDRTNEFDTKLAGLSGLVVHTHLSKEDVPFAHPFGGQGPLLPAVPESHPEHGTSSAMGDWNLDVHVDPPYEVLVAQDNNYQRGVRGTSDWYTALTPKVVEAIEKLGLPDTHMMHIETDQGLIPEAFRPESQDRVAVFGRWVVDTGHDHRAKGESVGRFTSEIHPPLIVAGARAQTAGAATHTTVIGRPFLVGQEHFHVKRNFPGLPEFGGEGVLHHIGEEMVRIAPKGFPLIPQGLHIHAQPQIYSTPFQGIQVVKYFVRPEYRLREDEELFVRFQFIVRPGVAVQVFDASDDSQDAVGVLISLNETEYEPAKLPQRHDWHLTIDDLDALKAGLGRSIKEYVTGIALGGPLTGADPGSVGVLTALIGQGVWTDSYDPPAPPAAMTPLDLTNPVLEKASATLSIASELGGGPHFTVDPTQPFPIIGYLDVSREPFPAPQ